MIEPFCLREPTHKIVKIQTILSVIKENPQLVEYLTTIPNANLRHDRDYKMRPDGTLILSTILQDLVTSCMDRHRLVDTRQVELMIITFIQGWHPSNQNH